MPLPFRLNARLGLLACALALTVGVPVIEAAVAPAPAEARAGGSYGGGSRSSFSGSLSSGWSSSSYRSYGGSSRSRSGGGRVEPFFVLMALGFCAFALVTQSKKPRGGQADVLGLQRVSSLDRLLEEAAKQDPAWREEALLQHARDTFEAVQRAWVRRDQDLAREYMTESLYNRHKAQTDGMRARGEKNVLDHLQITGARVVHLVDRLDDTKDKFWVHFTARAEDYLVDERSGRVLKGCKGEISVFKEIWKFKRDGRTWKLDQIDTYADQTLPTSFRDETA